jgi:hypothetical protein
VALSSIFALLEKVFSNLSSAGLSIFFILPNAFS